MNRAHHEPSARRGLLDTIETQRAGCEMAGSPLYAGILQAVAADVGAGGPCATLLDPLAGAPFGDAVLLRFLAAVHRLVLEGAEPELATQYPSTGGSPGPAAGRLFLAAVERHAGAISDQLLVGVQTNEPGRSAALLGGYLHLAAMGLPLRVLEVGASAGLNLHFDRYRYEAGDQAFGPADSGVRFVDPWVGRPPPLGLEVAVASRRGCDLDPIDPTTEAGRLRLRAYLWPDQPVRRSRLDAAIAVARAHPVVVDRDDAVSWVARQLADPAPGQVTVIVHSIVFQYLSLGDREAFVAEMEGAGRRATAAAPIAWLRMEPGGDRAEIRLTTWPGGRTDLLCTSAFHGPPVAWELPDVVRA